MVFRLHSRKSWSSHESPQPPPQQPGFDLFVLVSLFGAAARQRLSCTILPFLYLVGVIEGNLTQKGDNESVALTRVALWSRKGGENN